ncbi:WD repeat-containing protein [Carpediemonas membranifera]|uniref:WD repeat-containing protein n=1 Tax=Carpediemonas membranifera TaxID=201153 RepID=A0A8J6B2I5_9EUKA|nr:WD repeat-containing protein [Carpediemonas membranifera]|eukprot:KAG9397020.1 WD repeat-containing protein [Carpediemonas membranifera]
MGRNARVCGKADQDGRPFQSRTRHESQRRSSQPRVARRARTRRMDGGRGRHRPDTRGGRSSRGRSCSRGLGADAEEIRSGPVRDGAGQDIRSPRDEERVDPIWDNTRAGPEPDRPGEAQDDLAAQEVDDLIRAEEATAWSDLRERSAPDVAALLDRFTGVFAPLDETPARLPAYPVTLIDEKAVRQPVRQLAPALEEVANKQVEEWLRAGVIRRSKSSFASPIVLVRKKDRSWRLCVDYRRLNEVTRTLAAPVRDVQRVLMELGGATCFASLDLRSGYNQVLVVEEDRHKTAFVTPGGLYEFNRLPFGLKNAPSFFQQAMESVFEGISGVIIYMDDVLVMGRSREELMARLEAVLKRCAEYNLRLNAAKCDFARDSVEFLGHIVDKDGIRLGDDRVQAIMDMPRPTTRKEMRRFIGMVGWFRRFCPKLGEHLAPLNDTLTQAKVTWSPELEEAFVNVQRGVKAHIKLNHIDYNEDLILRTDASDVGLGGMLCNRTQDGQEAVVAVYSRAFHGAEKRWTTGEKEAFAIVECIRKWRMYLQGYTFTIETDHKNLTYMEQKTASAKVLRWRLALQEFDFHVIHLPGESNVVADTLSRNLPEAKAAATRPRRHTRRPNRLGDDDFVQIADSEEDTSAEEEDDDPDEADDPEERADFTQDAAEARDRERQLATGEMTEERKSEAVTRAHKGMAQHLGRYSTYRALKEKGYVWRGMWEDVKSFVDHCSCQKLASVDQLQLRMGTHMVETPFQKVAIDTLKITPEAESGAQYVVTVIDVFTRYVEIYPSVDKSAASAADAITRWIGNHGPMTTLHSDNGREFINETIAALVARFGTGQSKTFPYHPPSNGGCERANRRILQRLRAMVLEWGEAEQWDKFIPLVQRQLNTEYSEATGTTAARLVYGLMGPEPHAGLPRREPTTAIEVRDQDLGDEQEEYLRRARDDAVLVQRETLRRRGAHQADRTSPRVEIGDWVLVLPGVRAAKLLPTWEGPYEVVQVHDYGVTARRPDEDITTRVHFDRVRKFDATGWTREQLMTMNGRDMMEILVSRIKDTHVTDNGEQEFLVEWADGSEDWQPYVVVAKLKALDDYLASHAMESGM